jgi:hypothetical protein
LTSIRDSIRAGDPACNRKDATWVLQKEMAMKVVRKIVDRVPGGSRLSTAAGGVMVTFAADDPLVLNGTYGREVNKPGERARIAKAHSSQLKAGPMALAEP